MEQSHLRRVSFLGGNREQQLGYLFLFSPCTVLTSSPGMCGLYRKIIQEANFPNPSLKMMVSVPPSEPQFQMQSHPCHVETKSMVPGTFDPVFSKPVVMLLLSVTAASTIACFPLSSCHRRVFLCVCSLFSPIVSPLLLLSRPHCTASLEDPNLLYARDHTLYTDHYFDLYRP